MQYLEIASPAFQPGGMIPKIHTGDGEDVSPPLQLQGLCREAVSMVVILDDLDIPFVKNYSHWLLWNLPPMEKIPAEIPYGPSTFCSAVQGRAYGKNRYRGPYPPAFLKKPHRYVFRVYVLDCFLQLDASANRSALVKAMRGHVLQEGQVMGLYHR
ncbi:MAG: YbhB/YbcL family Raf kinase inhibitor-like protein [Oscillibacter sp.]|nr:YbhB/YbcL family Raf kinase inhibitor-like protein [Oscillibacter sp.]